MQDYTITERKYDITSETVSIQHNSVTLNSMGKLQLIFVNWMILQGTVDTTERKMNILILFVFQMKSFWSCLKEKHFLCQTNQCLIWWVILDTIFMYISWRLSYLLKLLSILIWLVIFLDVVLWTERQNGRRWKDIAPDVLWSATSS